MNDPFRSKRKGLHPGFQGTQSWARSDCLGPCVSCALPIIQRSPDQPDNAFYRCKLYAVLTTAEFMVVYSCLLQTRKAICL